MAAARWYDGTKIYRVAPNFVTQFGGNADNKPPIKGLEKPPASEFLNPALGAVADADRAALDAALSAANADRKDEDKLPSFASLLWDPYQVKASYAAGWPLGQKEGNSFLIHCRGTVSVPHYDPPDTGTGTELSVITGEASRNLDAAYGVVGRVIDGLQHLIDLPPGDDGGFYANKARNIPIASLRPATSLPEADRPAYQYLDSTSVVVVQAMQAHSKVTGQWRDSICAYPMLVRRTPPGE
jgi:peptidylprolyl isomerase